jgi:RIO-like serine/threonine protein kinase
MSERIIKQLDGFSGSTVLLIESDGNLFVRKVKNFERNFERMSVLSAEFSLPKILYKTQEYLDMEYIHGLDIKNYLKSNSPDQLIQFIETSINKLANNSVMKDYTTAYEEHLSQVDFTKIPFTKNELIDKLPKILPQSNYHGDLTLENIIHSESNDFYFIDPVTTIYDSWVFDIAKLRQDLDCKWFVRKEHLLLDVKLEYIQSNILEKFPLASSDYLLILMLLRVWRYTTPKTKEQKFILENLIRLWK